MSEGCQWGDLDEERVLGTPIEFMESKAFSEVEGGGRRLGQGGVVTSTQAAVEDAGRDHQPGSAGSLAGKQLESKGTDSSQEPLERNAALPTPGY